MKTEKQKRAEYTNLIHEGENIVIAPPGTINGEGGGETDVYTKSEVDTMIENVETIEMIDIIVDFENNTFSSENTFANVLSKIDNKKNIVLYDGNLIYQLIDFENNVIKFITFDNNNFFVITWSEDVQNIFVLESADNVNIIIADISTTQLEVWNLFDPEKINILYYENSDILYAVKREQAKIRFTSFMYSHNISNVGKAYQATTFNSRYTDITSSNSAINLTYITFIIDRYPCSYDGNTSHNFYTDGTKVYSNNSLTTEVARSTILSFLEYLFDDRVNGKTFFYKENNIYYPLKICNSNGDINGYTPIVGSYYTFYCIIKGNNSIDVKFITITIPDLSTYTVTTETVTLT